MIEVKYYLDVHIPRAVHDGLRLGGIEAVRAQDDGGDRLSDPRLLDRSTALGRVLVTSDADLLVEGARRQRAGISFEGLIYGHALRVSIGVFVRDLTLIAAVAHAGEMRNRVIHLPL